MDKDFIDKNRGMLVGLAVGDALGVQVEFMSAQEISGRKNWHMEAGGTHNLPKGCWTDDMSMAAGWRAIMHKHGSD